MKAVALAAIGALGLVSAAAPAIPAQAAPVYVQTIKANWPCGPGWHLNYWNRCVPNYGYYYGGPSVFFGFGDRDDFRFRDRDRGDFRGDRGDRGDFRGDRGDHGRR
ncbi:MAG TPA: hypothetical protein VKU90_03170 [Caulobacteraceae bacterium]|jgi:hypothetical protein|nr:hypothetical protein [Caulobacteraceae bacterium]